MKLKYEIKPDNLKVLQIKQIALNKDKFGALTFDKAYPQLHELRKMLVEFDDLGYHNLLTTDEVRDADNFKERLTEYVKRINNLNPETDATFNKNVRDNLENEIDSFYRSTTRHLRSNLVFLRQEAARKSRGGEDLAEQQKAATQAEQKYKELAEKLESRFQELNRQEKELEEKKKQVESMHGELAAVRLAKHFQEEVDKYAQQSKDWIKIRSKFYWGIVIIIIGLAAIYFYVGWDKISLQLGVAKIIFLSVLWYGLSFATRNYNINSHLAAVNRHRAAVARTLEDFFESNPEKKSEMLKNATEAMFKHVPVGFVTKAEKDSGNPLFEIVNKIINPKNSQ